MANYIISKLPLRRNGLAPCKREISSSVVNACYACGIRFAYELLCSINIILDDSQKTNVAVPALKAELLKNILLDNSYRAVLLKQRGLVLG